MTTSSRRRTTAVVPLPGALHKARERAGIASVGEVYRLIAAKYPSPGRAMTHRIFADNTQAIGLDLAERVADVLDTPVAALFVHKHGQSLAS